MFQGVGLTRSGNLWLPQRGACHGRMKAKSVDRPPLLKYRMEGKPIKFNSAGKLRPATKPMVETFNAGDGNF
jgi:hypothetical protein